MPLFGDSVHVINAGPDLGLVRLQATVIVGPQPPHIPTISIILLKLYKRIPGFRYSAAIFYIYLGGPISQGAPKHSFFCFYVNPPLYNKRHYVQFSWCGRLLINW